MRWYPQDPADTEGWHDQNADTDLLPHGYWVLSLADDRQNWSLRLCEQSPDLGEIIDEPFTATFPTEDAAKAFARQCETQEALPR